MFLAVPGHVIFLVAICSAESLGFPSVLFVLFYLIAALCQVSNFNIDKLKFILNVCTVTCDYDNTMLTC